MLIGYSSGLFQFLIGRLKTWDVEGVPLGEDRFQVLIGRLKTNYRVDIADTPTICSILSGKTEN